MRGILLGTFTEMDRTGQSHEVISLLENYIPDHMPLARTEFLGHGSDSVGIWIGKRARIGERVNYVTDDSNL